MAPWTTVSPVCNFPPGAFRFPTPNQRFFNQRRIWFWELKRKTREVSSIGKKRKNKADFFIRLWRNVATVFITPSNFSLDFSL
jgi:hypothetical protein